MSEYFILKNDESLNFDLKPGLHELPAEKSVTLVSSVVVERRCCALKRVNQANFTLKLKPALVLKKLRKTHGSFSLHSKHLASQLDEHLALRFATMLLEI